MGREIRRVPADWEHPKYNSPHYFPDMWVSDSKYGRRHPLFDKDYEQASEEWAGGFLLWIRGEHPDQKKYPYSKNRRYWDDQGGPPDMEYYRSKEYETAFKSEPTHYQLYETVTEGTPVSPKFPTLAELGNWLRSEGYSNDAVESFLEVGSAPSMILVGGKLYSDIESMGK